MIQNKMKLMLEEVSSKKGFKKLYRSGKFSYSKDGLFKGCVALVDDRAIVAYMQDVNDESREIGIANFQDNGTLVFKLSGDDWAEHKFEWKEKDNGGVIIKANGCNRDKIVSELSTIHKYCDVEPKKKSIVELIKEKRLSKKQVASLLQDSLKKLNQVRESGKREEFFEKVDVPNVSIDGGKYPNIQETDKTLEI